MSDPRSAEALADVLAQQARQDALDALYDADGRNDPHHPHHSTYTGLICDVDSEADDAQEAE